MKKILRRDFLIQTLALPVITVFLGRFLSACAKDSGAVTCSTGFTATSSNDDNHTHTITVNQSDITAAVDKTYTTTTTGSHNHTVTLTAADFAKLANNQGVTEAATDNGSGHTHSFVITCA